MVKANSNKMHRRKVSDARRRASDIKRKASDSRRKVSEPRRKASNARSSVAAFAEVDENKFMLLPDEIKLKFFYNLSPQDLGAVSATCSDFHRLFQDPSLWTELTVDIREPRRTLIWKVEKCPKLMLNTLKINNKNGIDPHRKIESLMRKFRFPNVELVGNWGTHEAEAESLLKKYGYLNPICHCLWCYFAGMLNRVKE